MRDVLCIFNLGTLLTEIRGHVVLIEPKKRKTFNKWSNLSHELPLDILLCHIGLSNMIQPS